MARRHAESSFRGKTPTLWGEHLPGIRSKLDVNPGSGFVVALTLDACSGKAGGYDPGIIAFLRENRIPATLFVTNSWIVAHPDVFKSLANDSLFEIGAHGVHHRPASVNGKSSYGIRGTASVGELVEEVEGCAEFIERLTGKRPRWYRSGTAFYDEVAVAVVQSLGMGVAGYSIAADEGATLPAGGVSALVRSAASGDIILCHMNHPESGTREGLRAALPILLQRGAHFVRLSDGAP